MIRYRVDGLIRRRFFPMAEEVEQNIIGLMKTSFTVSSIPIKDLKRFKKMADEYTGGNYAFLIIKLMDAFDSDWKYSRLNERISAIESASSERSESKERPKTFGG